MNMPVLDNFAEGCLRHLLEDVMDVLCSAHRLNSLFILGVILELWPQ